LLAEAQPWEATKIGGGTPPIRMPQGWLMIYHGVMGKILEGVDHQPHVRYSAGAMVLNIDDPRTVVYRSTEPILALFVGLWREDRAECRFPNRDRRARAGPRRYLLWHGRCGDRCGAARYTDAARSTMAI
jgi:hypothetical protein